MNNNTRNKAIHRLVGAMACLCVVPAAAWAQPVPGYIADALHWVERPPVEFTRDKFYKPGEILAMTGIKPGMVAVDLMPDSGYYMRILSDIVGPRGHVYAVIPQSNGQGLFGKSPGPLVEGMMGPQSRVERVTGFSAQPNIMKNTDVMAEWVDGKQYPNDLRYGNFALPKQVDVLVTAYDYHVFKSADFSHTDMHRFLGAIYRGMNDNGVVVVVDNTAAKGMPLEQAVQLNRMDPAVVKREMTAAGFVLERDSDLLAQAGDDRTSQAKDLILDRAAKPADAFVLVFRKPRNAPDTNQRPKDPLKALGGLFGNTMVVGNPPDSMHLLHADYTYQEIRGRSFDSGIWFFNADGWNCRYRPGTHFADCATTPHEYEHKVGDKWEAPHGHYELWKGINYEPVLGSLDQPQRVPTPGPRP